MCSKRTSKKFVGLVKFRTKVNTISISKEDVYSLCRSLLLKNIFFSINRKGIEILSFLLVIMTSLAIIYETCEVILSQLISFHVWLTGPPSWLSG